MEFQSPRFSGNSVLEEILNDPNTGTKKLGRGSPADAVRAVQQALLDLHWVENFRPGDGRVLVVPQFVDGDYGQWTTETVLAYKRNFDIHFPPDQPTGTFDGFTGPGTLKSLDQHCVMLDEADAAIRHHAEVLVASGAVASLEFAPPDGAGRTTKPIRRSAAASRSATINGDVGDVIHKRDLGAFALHGPLFVEWVVQELQEGTGDATGQLGFPVSEMFTSDTESMVQVERGSMVHDVTTGQVTVTIDPALSVLRHEVEF